MLCRADWIVSNVLHILSLTGRCNGLSPVFINTISGAFLLNLWELLVAFVIIIALPSHLF